MSQSIATPLVSAIVSTYRAERFLAGCLETLLAQSIIDRLEIIVIDSASPEGEGAVVARYQERHPGIVYIRTEERESLYQAWNRGVRLARGTYLTNTNTDDRLRPDALERLVHALEDHPESALAYGDVVVSHVPNRPFDWNLRDGWIVRPDYTPTIMARGCHMGPQPLWRRSVHDEVGLFDESLLSAADYDFWCRIALRHPLVHVQELLGAYYDNPDGICNANQELSAEETRAVMDRYRTAFPPPSSHSAHSLPPPAYVNVAMVTYNRLEFTRHAIAALAATADFPYVLNVVDNASSDGTREYLEEMQRQGVIRHLTVLPENVGVAKAANLAWSQEPEAAYYLKLDNDIVMTRPGWLRSMVDTLANDPELGAVAYNFEPRSFPLTHRCDRRLRIKAGNLGGACILIPRHVFDRLGYWCEDYGLYGEEDFDYGERLRLTGLLNAYMEDEDAGLHLPAGKAAGIDSTASARDGAEENLQTEYRAGKDQARRQATRLFGRVERNLADYTSGHKPLRCESAFVRAHASGNRMLSVSTLAPLPWLTPRAALAALVRRGNLLARRLTRFGASLPSLLVQTGPALRLLSQGKPGLIRGLNLARSNAQYRKWLAQDAVTSTDRYAMTRLLRSLEHRPLISVLMPVCDPPEVFLRHAIESVCRQAYPHWQLCIADDASLQPHVARILDEYAAREPRLRWVRRDIRGHIATASNTALELAEGDFIALLDHDDELAEDALLLVAWQLNRTKNANIVYSDEDKINAAGRRFSPDFKPDWNPDLMLSQNACGHLGVFRTSLVRQVGGFRPGTDGCQDWDLVLRLAEITPPEQIKHLPFVLYHWRTSSTSTAGRPNAKDYVASAARRVVEDALARRKVQAEVLPAPGNHLRLRYPLPVTPLRVSILIPTPGSDQSFTRLLQELVSRPPWQDMEILIAGSDTAPVTDSQPMLRYLPDLATTSPAAQCNGLAAAATGKVLVFLHPALAAPSAATLAELVAQVLRLEIGAVAPRLEAAEKIVGGGLVLGLNGLAGASYLGTPIKDSGVAGRAGLAQGRTVASASCLTVRQEVFSAQGGFDTQHFPQVFHDLDFCLRLGKAGLRVLWTPEADITVRNAAAILSPTATPDAYAAAMLALHGRWGEILQRDPVHNPNLALDQAWPTPAAVPRVTKPYRLA